MVIIDQEIGFMGGLDLCYGRMDDKSHPLVDSTYLNSPPLTEFPWLDYVNQRIKDFDDVRNYKTWPGNPSYLPRMPWHDIALCIQGAGIKDLARHFIQYWNYAKYSINPAKTEEAIVPRNLNQSQFPSEETKPESTQTFFQKIWQKKQAQIDLEQEQEQKINPLQEQQGLEIDLYIGEVVKASQIKMIGEEQKIDSNQNFMFPVLEFVEEESIEEEKQQQFELEIPEKKQKRVLPKATTDALPKMKQLDIPSENQQKASQLFICFNFLYKKGAQSIHNKGFKGNEDFLALLKQLREARLAKDEQQQINHMEKSNVNLFNIVENSIKQLETEEKDKLKLQGQNKNLDIDQINKERVVQPMISKKPKIKGTCQTQMVRSSSNWSLGLQIESYENSIHIAYLQLISEAEHFIYIENQFFISSIAGNPVKNLIAEALVKRIKKAAELQQKFKVYVLMPLLPGFAGEINESGSAVMKIQLHWELMTFCRGNNSIYSQLSKDKNISDPFEYIRFYGLRQHGILNEKPVTEIIYIHSKLLIVDDKTVLIGSANINDRSMLGNRDSEIAMVIEDQEAIKTVMNGETYKARKFAHTLRQEIFQEHFGLTPEESIDPLAEEMFKKISETAKNNTQIYRELFYPYPDDYIIQLSDLDKPEMKAFADIDTYKEKSCKIIAHVVEQPIHFLEKENLTFKCFNKEYLVPEVSFT